MGVPRRIVTVLVLSVAAWGADNPFVGTWKLNLAKSKFDPGPPVRSRTVTIEAIGENAVRWSIDQVDADGNHATVVEMPRLDGKDYPRTVNLFRGGKPSRVDAPDTIALQRIDTYTLEETLKRNGKVVATYRQVVSKDSKTRTATQTTGTNVNGQAVHDVLVFDKQ